LEYTTGSYPPATPGYAGFYYWYSRAVHDASTLFIAFTISGLFFVLFQGYFEEAYPNTFAADFKKSWQTSVWRSLVTVTITYIVYFIIAGLGVSLYLLIPMILERI